MANKTTPQDFSEHTKVVIVGISDYLPEYFEYLKSPAYDAEILAEALKDREGCAIPEKNIKLRTKEVTKKILLEDLLKNTVDTCNGKDTLLFYFAGHGLSDEKDFYLCCYNTDPNNLTDTAFSGSEMSIILSKITARGVLIILDCCKSAGFAEQAPEFFRQQSNSEFRILFSSSKKDQQSWEFPRDSLQGGGTFFTKHLINVIRGNEHVSKKEKGFIYFSELFDHIQKEVAVDLEKKKTTYVQEPVCVGVYGKDPLLFCHKRLTLEEINLNTSRYSSYYIKKILKKIAVVVVFYTLIGVTIIDQSNIKAQKAKQLEQQGFNIQERFKSGSEGQIEILHDAIQAGLDLKQIVNDNLPLDKYPTVSPLYALNTVLDNINEVYRIEKKNEKRGNIISADYSSNGKMIITRLANGKVVLWDDKGIIISEFDQFDSFPVNNVEFSPNNEYFLLTHPKYGSSGTVYLLNMKGNKIREFKVEEQFKSKRYGEGQLLYATFNPNISQNTNDPYLMTIYRFRESDFIQLWTQEGQLIKYFSTHEVHQKIINGTNFSTDGKLIITFSEDYTAAIWDLEGNFLSILNGHNHQVTDAEFSPNNEFIATASKDGKIRIWKKKSDLVEKIEYQFLREIKAHNTPIGDISISFSHDGKFLASASKYDKIARLWNLKGDLIKEFTGHQGGITKIDFSSDDQRLITTSLSDHSTRVWIIGNSFQKQRKGIITIEENKKVWLVSAEVCNNKDLISTTSYIGGKPRIKLFNLEGLLSYSFNIFTDINYVHTTLERAYIDNHCESIITYFSAGSPQIWSFNGENRELLRFDYAFGGNAGFVAIPSLVSDDKVEVWNLKGEKIIDIATTAQHYYFQDDGNYVVTLSDKIATVWNLKGKTSAKEIAKLNGHTEKVNSASFSKDGQLIVTASNDTTARIWTLKGTSVGKVLNHERPIRSAHFSPDGKFIITASDKTVRVWTISGDLLRELRQDDLVVSAEFANNGKQIMTASKNGTIKIWPVKNLNQLIDFGCKWLEESIRNQEKSKDLCNIK